MGKAAKIVKQVVSAPFKAVNEVVKAVPIIGPAIDKGLVGLDKAVGKSIPGGWGTVAAVASSFIPGAQFLPGGMLSAITPTQLATGLGALTGSGVLKKDNRFNLQGALMGGAMAYGASKLTQGLMEAGSEPLSKSIEGAAKAPVEGGTSYLAGTGSEAVQGASRLTPTANALQNIPTEFVPPINAPTAAQSFAPSGDYGLKNLASNIPTAGINPAASVPSGIGYSAAPSFLEKAASGASNIGGGMLSNVGTAGQGIANLVTGAASVPASMTLTNTALPLFVGTTGMMALEEQQKQLDEQRAAARICPPRAG
jgi:hypothetical protein